MRQPSPRELITARSGREPAQGRPEADYSDGGGAVKPSAPTVTRYPSAPAAATGPDLTIRLWCVSSSYPRRYKTEESSYVTTKPSRSTQKRRASARSVTTSVAYADRTMSGTGGRDEDMFRLQNGGRACRPGRRGRS